jgi:glycerol-3-phosphate dehydrogenase
MSVALVERTDFAAGTSSRSSKLIHGGIRYLEQGDVGLVLEACRERDLLRARLAPHLCGPQPFVFPIYEGDAMPSAASHRLGPVTILLAGLSQRARAPHAVGRRASRARARALLADGLKGGGALLRLLDGRRPLTLETGWRARGRRSVLNYCVVIALEKDSAGRLAAAVILDRTTGETTRAFAPAASSTSPAVARSRAQARRRGRSARLMLTKGVHAVFDRDAFGQNRDAVVIRGAGDDRVMFAIPWQDQTLSARPTRFYEGDPADVAADADDVDYLLETTNRAFPRANVTAADVISTYAGLRPLVAPEDEIDESDISREDEIFESPSGLISLGGGKLTTHRHVAERIVDIVARRIGRRTGRCRTGAIALPSAEACGRETVSDAPPASADEHLRRRYGALAADVDVSTCAPLGSRARRTIVDDMPAPTCAPR